MSDASTHGVSGPGEPVRRGTGAEGFPHGSKYPLFVGAGMFLTGLGLVWMAWLLVGIPVLIYGIAGWTWEYTVEEYERGIIPEQKRQLLGMETGLLSMYVVVAGEILVFLSVFVAWFYLSAQRSGSFPPAADLPTPNLALGAGMMIGLGLGSVTIHLGRRSIERGDRRPFLVGFSIALLAGLVYLGLLGLEWSGLVTGGFDWTTGPYGATFFALTGLHAAHLLAGLAMVSLVLARATYRGHFSEQRNLMPRTTEIYWHFLTAVSVLVFVFVYFPMN